MDPSCSTIPTTSKRTLSQTCLHQLNSISFELTNAGCYDRDSLASFDRERIPERVVHAKGSGAHGVFTVSRSIDFHDPQGSRSDDVEKLGERLHC